MMAKKKVFFLDIENKKMIGGARTNDGTRKTKMKTRDVSFASNDFALLHASQTATVYGFRGKFEHSAAFSYNLKNDSITQLLKDNDDLFPAQTGLGDIVGLSEDGKSVFMPAFVGSRSSDPSYSLMRVNLDSGRARVYKRGRNTTRDWFVDRDGTVLATEQFDDARNVYSINAGRDGKLKQIYSVKAKIPPVSVVGVKVDRSALIVNNFNKKTSADQIVEMSFEGKFSQPVFQKDDANITRILKDQNQIVYGVQYSGLYPSYEFFDESLTADYEQLAGAFGGAAVYISGWAQNFEKLLLRVAGGKSVPAYYIFDRGSRKFLRTSITYESLTADDIAEVVTVNYKARDKKRIPAVLTRPLGWEEGKAYPTIIMPHGGPEAFDAVGFDWMAQYFASRGYMVLQPNFRGSSGFGTDFKLEGRGEWGRGVMQHDVTDGLQVMIRAGWTDPSRVCIIGGSYGGYSALAGGAFTPDLYSCVAAIAPVTDLVRMIEDERRDNGRNSWVVDYWQKLIGDRKSEKDKLKERPPARFAESFKAPVLLIHGNDDTVVPFRQSQIMESALKKAGKDVTLVKLRGEDHYLSRSETRLATLKALSDFVEQHIGDDQ